MNNSLYENCNLCPRNCGVNRFEKRGFCGETSEIKIACGTLHFGEEPCISGNNGEGKTNLIDSIYYMSMTKSAFASSGVFLLKSSLTNSSSANTSLILSSVITLPPF